MDAKKLVVLVCCCFLCVVATQAKSLPCKTPGKERWPVKTTLPPNALKQTKTLADALKIPRLTDVKVNDARYQSERITDQPVKEDAMVTVSGWLYLVAFESDDCDFHIQLSPKPLTTTKKPTPKDNSLIVEVPSGQYATTIAEQVEAVRQWVIDNLLAKEPPTIGSQHVMVHPVYVSVTGALFYDDAHEYKADGTTGRGKKGLLSKTLWELHPVTKISFAPKPSQ